MYRQALYTAGTLSGDEETTKQLLAMEDDIVGEGTSA
jgi:hypothetical protein